MKASTSRPDTIVAEIKADMIKWIHQFIVENPDN